MTKVDVVAVLDGRTSYSTTYLQCRLLRSLCHVALGQMVEVGHVTGAVHVRDALHRLPGGKAAGDAFFAWLLADLNGETKEERK